MFKERIFVFAVAIFAGIVLSVGLFYLYQKTKVVTTQKNTQETSTPLAPTFYLNIDTPTDEEVFDKNILQLSGKTLPGAQVIVILEDRELAMTSGADGSFSTNITLVPGTSVVEVLTINSDGKMLKEKRTLTFTREEL